MSTGRLDSVVHVTSKYFPAKRIGAPKLSVQRTDLHYCTGLLPRSPMRDQMKPRVCFKRRPHTPASVKEERALHSPCVQDLLQLDWIGSTLTTKKLVAARWQLDGQGNFARLVSDGDGEVELAQYSTGLASAMSVSGSRTERTCNLWRFLIVWRTLAEL